MTDAQFIRIIEFQSELIGVLFSILKRDQDLKIDFANLIQSVHQSKGVFMSKFDEVKQAQLDNTATLQRGFAEVQAKITELIASQGDIDALIAEAVAAKDAQNTATFDAKMDEIKTLQAEQSVILTALDNLTEPAVPPNA